MDDEEKMDHEGELLVPQERREYPRIAINVAVKYRILTKDEADYAITKKFDPEEIFKECNESRALNISKSGLLMNTKEEIEPKSFIAVSMYLPLPGLSCACRALAEVVRCEKKGEEFVVGVKFLRILHHKLNKYGFLTLTQLLEITGEEIKLD